MRVKFKGEYPMCFTAQQWEEWKEAARTDCPAHGPCNDCTPEFKNEMMEKNRCENPQVVFLKNADGSLSGHLPTYLF